MQRNEQVRFYNWLLDHAPMVLIALGIVLFGANTWGVPIYILDEAKNAECAREMWARMDWIVPTFNGDLRTDKPPLHYFFMMLAYSFFDANAFSARLFSGLMGVLMVWLTFFYTARALGRAAGFWAGMVLLSSLHVLLQFHLAVPDPYLVCCMTAAVFAFHEAIVNGSKRQLYIGYVATALGVLAKGPVALGLVGLIMLLYLILHRKLNWAQLKDLRLVSGGALFLAIAVPWYVAVGQATDGQWLNDFFFHHNLNRFGSTMESHGGGFGMTLLYVFVGLLPFVVVLPQAVHWAWQKRSNSLLAVCLISVAVIVGFFGISSTKLPNYTVPSYPFFAVLLGYFVASLIQEKGFWKRYRVGISLGFWAVLAVAFPIGTYIGLEHDPFLSESRALAWTFVPFVIGVLVMFYCFHRGQRIWGLLSWSASCFVVSLVFFYGAFPVVNQQNPVANSLELLQGEEVACFKRLNRAYVFALQTEIPVLNTEQEVRLFFEQYPDGKLITLTKLLPEIESLQQELDTLFLQADLFDRTTTIILEQKTD